MTATMPDSVTPRKWLLANWQRRPAVFVAVAMMVGIALHKSFPPTVFLVSGAALFCAACAALWRGRTLLASAFVLLGAMLAGVVVAQIHTYRFPSNHISHFVTLSPRLAQLELSLDRPPRILGDPFSVGRALPPKQVCLAKATRVLTWKGWVQCSGDVLVQIDQAHPRVTLGAKIRVLGMIQRPSPAMNPGQFDWESYYREQRVLCSIGVAHAQNIQILHDPRTGDGGVMSPLGKALSMLRGESRRLLALGFDAEESLDHALMRALLLGDHDPELRDVQEQFRRTGTSHHLAISGMHVAVLGGVVLGVCRLVRLSPRVATVVATVFVVIYGLAALPSPPVVRSVLLCVAYAIGVLGRRTIDPLQLLALSVIAMMAYHPADLFNAGFQLSFGTVFGLIVFTPPLLARFQKDDPDLVVLRSFGQLTTSQKIRMKLRRWTIGVLVAAVVAWVVSTPLVAYHFEQLNAYAVLGSVVLAPFVFVALVCGLLKVLLTMLIPPAAPVWAEVAALSMQAMRDVVGLLSRLPGSDVALPRPPLWMLFLFYAMLLLLRLPGGSRAARRGMAGLVGAAGALLVSLSLVGGVSASADQATAPVPDEVSITLLSIGAGQCAVVAPPQGPLVLIDCGSGTVRDPLRRCVAPYVRHLGRSSVDRLVLTHGDFDHISAASDVVQAYGVREIMTGPHFRRHAANNPPAAAMLEFFERGECDVVELLPGNRISLGGGCAIETLWPERSAGELSSNDAGLVLKLTYAGRSVLFPADLQDEGLKRLFATAKEKLRADVLIAPHHGSAEESTSAFVEAVDPQFVLSSNDRSLSRKQQDFERLLGGRTLYRTHRDGAITIRITRGGELRVIPFLKR